MIQASGLLAIVLVSVVALSHQFNATDESLQKDVKVVGNFDADLLDKNSTVNVKEMEQPDDDEFQQQNSTEIIEAVDLPAIEMAEELRHGLEKHKEGEIFNETTQLLEVKVVGNFGDDILDQNLKGMEQLDDDSFLDQNSTEIIEAVDLPADPFTIEMVEELRHVLEKNKEGELLNETTQLLDELEGKARQKRWTRINSAYCCARSGPSYHLVYQTRISCRTREYTYRRVRCSWWGNCWTLYRWTVYKREYYVESYAVREPAPEWNYGCPARLIRCCDGYGRYHSHCLSYSEISDVYRLQRLYPEYDFICTMLGICGANPYNIYG